MANPHKQSLQYTLQLPDPYDLQRDSRDDEHTEEKIEEDQWEWSMSGMSTIEKDWKGISSFSFRNNITAAERPVKLHSEVSVHDLTKRANRILGLLLQRDTSILPQDHTFPTSTALPRPFLLRNDNSGYTDELSDESDCSLGDNDDLPVDDNISTISPLTFATAYTSVSVITKASIILDLKMKNAYWNKR